MEDDLIGGNWVATAGYEDGEARGEPNCQFFEEGLEFKEKGVVYNASFDENLDYHLSERGKVTEITFLSEKTTEYRFNIHEISENEMGFEGQGFLKMKHVF